MSWENTIEQPELEQLNRVGAPSWEVFLQAGNMIADTIAANIDEYFADKNSRPRVLDFGSGVGRVFLPLHFRGAYELLATDIDANAIAYLGRVTDPSLVYRNSFDPPLGLPEASFDCVYSVSIWTHLSPAAQMPWLHEIARVLKPGGLALITVCGHRSLELRHGRGDAAWKKVTDEELRRAGILYREYETLNSHPHAYPGVTASYGSTLHDPDFLRREWSTVMDIVDIKDGVIAKSQDLVVMTRR